MVIMEQILSHQFDYYQFQRDMVIRKINEEIEFYQSTKYCTLEPFRSYLKYLRERIGLDKENHQIFCYDHRGNRQEIRKMNMDEYARDLDILMFKKPWNKLKEFHKIMKIKEFINKWLPFDKRASFQQIEENIKYIEDEIIDGLKNKRFNKNKSEIEYDQERMRIISISCLSYDEKTGLYKVEWE